MSRESRFISRVLRHAPQDAGLTLDAAGWAPVSALLKGMRAAGHRVSREDVVRIVAENDKQRFALSEDGMRIRAVQGHSVPVELGLAPAEPPEVLFHGTASKTLGLIFRDGILPMSRRMVHLSASEETARAVGARHGTPVILRVEAPALVSAGHPVYQAENGVWLTDAVPLEFLTLVG